MIKMNPRSLKELELETSFFTNARLIYANEQERTLSVECKATTYVIHFGSTKKTYEYARSIFRKSLAPLRIPLSGLNFSFSKTWCLKLRCAITFTFLRRDELEQFHHIVIPLAADQSWHMEGYGSPEIHLKSLQIAEIDKSRNEATLSLTARSPDSLISRINLLLARLNRCIADNAVQKRIQPLNTRGIICPAYPPRKEGGEFSHPQICHINSH